MPHFLEQEHIFEQPWDRVTCAIWRKYPHPRCPHVSNVEILDRRVDESSHELHSRRLIGTRSPIPAWAKKLFRLPETDYFVVEDSTVDAAHKKMVMVSKNLSGSSIIEVEETCSYTPHPENPNWTVFRTHTAVKAFPRGFTSQIESFLVTRFRENAAKGRAVVEEICDRIRDEGRDALSAASSLTPDISVAAASTLE